MARPKKQQVEPEKKNSLLEALNFLSLITKKVGAPNETHISLGNKQAWAFNGVLSAGQRIEEDIIACPHNSTIVEALAKCSDYIEFLALDQHRLSIKSGKFKAIIPCLEPYVLEVPTPDPPVAIIDDRLKYAIEAVAMLAFENSQRVVTASILLNGGSTIGTDSKVIIEYWHGLDLPSNIAMPKQFAEAILGTKKKLKHFGYSSSSVTFYFQDDSWLRTQLYAEPWPDVRKILDQPSEPLPLPPDFFKALSAVLPFSPDGLIHCGAGLMHSHPARDLGASYEVLGLPAGLKFVGKQFMILKPYIETIDLTNQKVLMWFGKNCRGAIAGHM